jgi:hypothetical protein
MEKIWKKSMIIGITALFVSISMAPAFSSEATSIEQTPTTTVEYATVEENGKLVYQSIEMTEDDIIELQSSIAALNDLLKSQQDMPSIIQLLLRYLDNNNYPILSKLISYLLNAEFLKNKDLVVSQGWSYNFNPFKKASTDFMKPFAVWRYTKSPSMLVIPSTTTIINFNPMEVKTLAGGQIGVLLRFKGFYIHIPKPLPDESFTFFIGFARYAGGIELPTLSNM